MELYNLFFQAKGNKYEKQILQLRHEDFALSPLETTRKIYEFIGRPATRGVLDWVERSTSERCRQGTRGSQGTCRDAKKVVGAWRSWYKWEEVKMVQEECRGALEMNGYKVYDSFFDLVDLDVPSF